VRTDKNSTLESATYSNKKKYIAIFICWKFSAKYKNAAR